MNINTGNVIKKGIDNTIVVHQLPAYLWLAGKRP